MTTEEELRVTVFDLEGTSDEELTIDLEVTTEAKVTEELTVPVVDSEGTMEELT